MKKIKLTVLVVVILSFFVSSCFEDNDDVINPATKTEIGDFIWKAMNLFYLYQADVADLADDRFANQGELNNYIADFSSPETLFENLIFDRPTTDKFSWIVSDYEALEASFSGVSKKNGMAFAFFADPDDTSNKAYGYVRYVLPNSDAASKNITRGTIFNTVNGVVITYDLISNAINGGIINDLNQDSYSIGLATYDSVSVSETGETVALTKSVFEENPILISETLNVDGTKIGYLAYNAFTANYDDQLNESFANFQTDGVTDLVLDLRYNPGGSVHSAVTLASLVTGQFTGQVFSKEQWNDKWQTYYQDNDPSQLINNFVSTTRNGQNLHSLNLPRVYVITTGRSASASELVINGLNPYIDVVQIGTTTTGKFQASVTLYDSANFGKTDANRGHKYALQPLVFKSLNSVDFTDYLNGFTPEASMELAEDYSNMDILGNVTEPLLALAINNITNSGRVSNSSNQAKDLKMIDYKNFALENTMYLDKTFQIEEVIYTKN